jgi:AraC family transcriptional regulator
VKQATQTFYAAAVARAIDAIVSRLDEAVDPGELAGAAALSPLHFHRIFRGMVGETALEMHRRLRLERAASQLQSSSNAVTTIALNAGYESHEAFTRAFRDNYATSPREFRERSRDAISNCADSPSVLLASRVAIHFNSTHQHKPQFRYLPGALDMNVELETLGDMRIAALSHIGPYNKISDAFARLGMIAGPAGLFASPAASMIALYYDDPDTKPASELRSDAGIVVADSIAIPSTLHECRIAAGRFAKYRHQGPYSFLGDVWSQFMGVWLPQSGHRLGSGVSFELYRNNPMTTKPDELLTDIYIPLS